MKNPFHVLHVPVDASDATVKKAYLQQVRKYSPERYPERFREVRTAFEAIATHRDRLRFRLFQVPDPDIPHLFRHLFAKTDLERPSERPFLDSIAADLKNIRLNASVNPTPTRQSEE